MKGREGTLEFNWNPLIDRELKDRTKTVEGTREK